MSKLGQNLTSKLRSSVAATKADDLRQSIIEADVEDDGRNNIPQANDSL